MLKTESGRTPRRLLALALAVTLVAGACGNSKDKADSSSKGTTATSGEKVSLNGVPGVSNDEIRYAVLGTRTNNPLGTCILDCFLDGVNAYFAYRNDAGGVYGRKLVVAKDIDDALGANQAKALEIISANDTFATFNASTIASGFPEFAKAKVPLYIWAIQAKEMAGQTNIFGNREVVCIACVSRNIPYVAKLAKAKKVATLGYGISDASKDCADSGVASMKKYGKDVGAEIAYTNNNLSFGLPNGIGPEVSAMKAAGVDLIAGCLDLNGMKTLAQELQRQGMKDVKLFHSNTYDQKFVEEAGVLFEGDYVQAAQRPFEATEAGSALGAYKKWMKKSGKQMTEPSMVGWINATLAYDGLVAAGPKFDRAKVIAATNKLTHFTAGGLTQPVDWSRQHVPPTEADYAAHSAAQDCLAVVTVGKGGTFKVAGNPAKPWNCWSGKTLDWSEPVPTNFK